MVLAPEAARRAAGERWLGGCSWPELTRVPACTTPMLPDGIRPAALLTVREQPRPGARDTLEFFRTECVGLKVTSADDPRTAAVIARRVVL